jgi:serine/threonine protein kinase
MLRMNRWNFSDKIRFMLEIACGVEYLHSKNIVHRNIKPENIFRWGEILKIGDLGVAKLIDGSHMSEDVAPFMHMSP